MILTTLSALALGAYTARTVLGLCKDDDIKKTVSNLRSTVVDAVKEARDDISDAISKPKDISSQNDQLISKVLTSATDQERQTIVAIFEKYAPGKD